MITDITLSNYRSLDEGVTVRLGAFTALVGPNGSGKSNVVDALPFVSDALRNGLAGAITDRDGIDAVRRWSAEHPFNVLIRLNVRLPAGHAAYSFELAADRLAENPVQSEPAS